MTEAEPVGADGSAPAPAPVAVTGAPPLATAEIPVDAADEAVADTATEIEIAAGAALEAGSDAVGAPPGGFDDFELGPDVRTAIAAMGYEKPTDVQTEVIGAVLAGADVVVQAKTGSGKTAAFGVPIVERLDPGGAAPGAPLAVILTPTRELANQVAAELARIAETKGVTVLPVYGGVSLGHQAQGLAAGADIVVGTPGRVRDHIRRGNLFLGEVAIACLDEADEMLSMGFWDDVTDLLKMMPAKRQTMLFSATLPYQVAKAAAVFLTEPRRIDVSGDALTVEGISNAIVHILAEIPKPRQLLYLLETEQPRSAIVFCNTRNETEMIAKYLTQAGFVAEAITGNFHQRDRERVMERIKSGDLRYMVATDVASRGIDISNLTHVVNYSLPEFTEVYVHRVGRTGRMESVGTAISLVDGKGLMTLAELERQYNITFTERVLPPEEEVLARRSKRIMSELSEKASVAEVGQHLDVAKEIVNAQDAQQVVAFLLKSYFSGQTAPRRSPEKRPPRETQAQAGPQDRPADGESPPTRRRRRRRRRPGSDGPRRGASTGSASPAYDTLDASEALAGRGDRLPPPANPAPGGNGSAPTEQPDNGMTRVRVNIGFDDGFKGRGAVAKKISALAGLNDGIVTEVESRREYAVLQATPDIAELLIERVDGAQIGKKIVSVAAAN